MPKVKKRRVKNVALNSKKLKLSKIETCDADTSDSDTSFTQIEVTQQPEELIDEDNDEELEKLKKQSNDSTLFNDNESHNSKQYEEYFEHELCETELKNLQQKYQTQAVLSWENLHQIMFLERTESSDAEQTKNKFSSLEKGFKNPEGKQSLTNNFGINKLLSQNWFKMKKAKSKGTSNKLAFTPLQNEFFSILLEYVSLYFPSLNVTQNVEEIRSAYCLHVLNHIFQGRSKVLKNNKNLAKLSSIEAEQAELRDQGIVRPKVIILAPFRETALKIVNIFLELLKTDKKFEISYLKRFKEEFSPDEEDAANNVEEVNKNKPLDYQKMFTGNTDEHFRVGIALLHSAFRLYAPFYSSDIIVASPLGLRTIIGAQGESHYEYDFLSSVEMLIFDSADIFMMQNWEHVIHIMKHLHKQPIESHGVDFSRVRNSSLDGQAKHYCQTVLLSNVSSPQISSLLTKYCYNYKGLAMVKSVYEKGTICTIPKAVPQIFHKLNITSEPFAEIQNARFKFFLDQILNQIKEKKMANVLIYVPQYFDYVRLRNHMRREKKAASGPHFGYICEYTKPTEVGKARRRFLTGKFPILLYTERYHFYHRPSIRGIRHLIFYELPTYPQFYSELCNMVHLSPDDMTVASNSVIALYSKYDTTKLMPILGTNRVAELLKSKKHMHMFLTGNKV